MISTSIRLLRIQLLKDFGINEVMHCRDSGKKRKLVFMLCIFIDVYKRQVKGWAGFMP